MADTPNTTLTPHQLEIFNNIINDIKTNAQNVLKSNDIYDRLISLSGPAGTGKTYLTIQIVKYFCENKDILDEGLCITAPTHKAVSVFANILRENNIQASYRTIHSFLGIKPIRDYKTGKEKFTVDKSVKKPSRATLLLVDESSMISSDLYEYILEAVMDERVNIVLFIGDPYQLLPVDGSETEIFTLKHQYKLTEIVRQAKDSYIIKIATKLRERIANKDFIDLRQFFKENYESEIEFFYNQDEFVADFYKNKDWHKEDKILGSYTNQSVDGFNRIIRGQFWREKGQLNPPALLPGDMLRFLNAYVVNDVVMYHNGQTVTIEEAILRYHKTLEIEYWDCKVVGALQQQVFRVVDPNSNMVFNDKLKQIVSFAKEAQKNKDGYKAKQYWQAFFQTRDMFANVQYIFSSTIHKLQGSTYDTSYIDLFSLVDNEYISDDEKYRLAYVAITRARKNIKIFIPKFNTDNEEQKIVNSVEKHHKIDNILENIFAKSSINSVSNFV
jgi:ATP-dependent exoDNAse (exonuclease V) alpha subunit